MYISAALTALVLIYLQWNFLSLLNLIVIGIMSGSLIAVKDNKMFKSIAMLSIAAIIITSFVFKIIYLVQTLTEYLDGVDVSGGYKKTTQFLSKNKNNITELDNSELLDLSKEMKQLSCKEEGFTSCDDEETVPFESCDDDEEVEPFASCDDEDVQENFEPTKFVDGNAARSILDNCAVICQNHASCNLVTMENDGEGNNNECKFYKTSETVKELKTAFKNAKFGENEAVDRNSVSHYAVIER